MAVGVIFDGDDTLWITEPLYDEARVGAREIVAASGLDGDKWEEVERRIDVENVALMGHGRSRFPTSCVQAYEHICEVEGRTPDSSIKERIRRAAEAVFERVAPVAIDALETLEGLRTNGARLALLTKGDPQVQRFRITSSGLEHLFDVVEIVSEKTPSVIRAVLNQLNVDIDFAWMVGNSVRSDVLPALSAGLRVVWIEAHVWEYEKALGSRVGGQVITVTTLSELPSIVFV